MSTARRVSYVFLCMAPFLSFVVGGFRALRVPGVYQAAGVVYFAAIAVAAWTLGARAMRADGQDRRFLSLAGILLITPFARLALLWVGLGPALESRLSHSSCLSFLMSSCFGARVKSSNPYLPPPAVTDLIVLDDKGSSWP